MIFDHVVLSLLQYVFMKGHIQIHHNPLNIYGSLLVGINVYESLCLCYYEREVQFLCMTEGIRVKY